MFYPAITTAALFTAVIINDLITKHSSSITNHAFLGLISVFGMVVLSMKNLDIVGWGLLILPMFVIILSFLITYFSASNGNGSSNTVAPSASPATTTASPAGLTPASTQTGQTVQLPVSAGATNSATLASVTPSGASCTSH